MDSIQVKKESQTQNLASQFKIESICGSIGGMLLCLTMHPFETLKVRMQITNQNLFRCVMASIKSKRGIFSLYDGLSSPFYVQPIVNAIVYSSKQFFVRTSGLPENSFYGGLLSGMFAGSVNSFIIGPVDLIVIRLQMQMYEHNYKKTKIGPCDVVKQLVRQQGFKGILQGQYATQLREMVSYGTQFAFFDAIKGQILKIQKKKVLNFQEQFIVGGISGMICWLLSYPIDIIKTKLQFEQYPNTTFKKNPFLFDGGFFSCLKQTIRKDGVFSLFQGLSPCMIGAFISNGFLFVGFEQAEKILFPQNYAQEEFEE